MLPQKHVNSTIDLNFACIVVGDTKENWNMKWKHLFPAHILERGWDYYQSDAVENLQKSENGYTAEVEGTEIYDVEVVLSQNTVQDMWCSCPYAEDGAYCKHMAAVLYALEEDDLLLDTPSVSDDALRRAVSDLSEEDAKKLLLQLGLGDLNTRLKILSFGSGDVPDVQQDTWEVQIAELTRRRLGSAWFYRLPACRRVFQRSFCISG